MPKGHATLKFLRKVHLYIGIFTSPALLFFAITGAMQTFSLHETTQGSSYKPPAWIAQLAQLHKKQTTTVPVRKQRLPTPENAPGDGQRGDAGSHGAGRGPGAANAAGAGSGAPAPASGPVAPGLAVPSQNAQAASVPPAPQKSHLPMKIFFLLISLSLTLSTLTGIYMSYKYSRGPWVVTGLLVAGVVAPLLLLPF